MNDIKIHLSDPQQDILESTKQINLFLAGYGSGKTYLGGIISYLFIQRFPNLKGFVGANTYDQLNSSTFTRIADVWSSFGISEYNDKSKTGHYVIGKQPPKEFKEQGHNFISYQNILTFCNGATIFLGSLENAKSHEGKEFAWAILDETKDSREEDVKEVILSRLRQKGLYTDGVDFTSEGDPVNPLYILTSPAKVDWINRWFKLDDNIEEIENLIYSDTTYFRKSFDNKFCTISSTYHNQHNLPENYIENKRFDYTDERFKALIYANPFAQTGGEYYSSFSRLSHVGDCYCNKELPLHITFDFNAVPYNTLLIFQIETVKDTYHVKFIDEICLQNPRNSTEELCDEFIRRYPRQPIFIYGDATGRARTVLNKLYKSQYDVIFNKLQGYLNNTSDRVPLSNKPNLIRRDFINKIFEEKLPVRILIHRTLHTLINDLTYTKQGADGLKDKRTVKDEVLGKIQKWGHCGDAMEYGICEAFKGYLN